MISEEYLCSQNNQWGQMQNFSVSQHRENICGTTVLKTWNQIYKNNIFVHIKKGWTKKWTGIIWFGTAWLFDLFFSYCFFILSCCSECFLALIYSYCLFTVCCHFYFVLFHCLYLSFKLTKCCNFWFSHFWWAWM